jgi:hypothetical protein
VRYASLLSVAETTSEVMRITMWRRLFKMPVLLYSIAISILVWFAESFFHYQIFNPGYPFEIIPSDPNELWMRLMICGIIVIFGGYIQHHTIKKRSVEEEKLRTLKATMHTVEDSVGNALLSIKYLLLDAGKNQNINLETLKDILHLINTTMSQLREIRNLKLVSEKQFANDVFCLDTGEESNMHSIK